MRPLLSLLAQRLRCGLAPLGPRQPGAGGHFAKRARTGAGAGPRRSEAASVPPDPVATRWAWSTAQPCDLQFADDALSRVILNHAPVLDRRYAVVGTRLTVHAVEPLQAAHVADLLQAVGRVWPEAAGHRVSLNLAGEAPAQALIRLRPARNILIEVPAAVAVARQNRQHLKELQANGNLLQIRDCAAQSVPPELLRRFQYVLAGLSEPIRLPTSSRWPLPEVVRADIRSLSGMQASFAGGAVAVTGWPMATPWQAARRHPLRTNSRAQIVSELLRRINRDEPLWQLEDALSQDPTVAYKLLRYVNSATFNLPVKVVALRDAVAVLGRNRLNRWLVVTLAASAPRADLRPTTFAALRRGVMMEELGRLAGHGAWGDELFICGTFSLMDRMLGQPMRDLLAAISVPAAITQALVVQSGRYAPYLRLTRALENGPFELVRQTADELGLSLTRVNHTLLQATARAVELGQY